MSRTLVLAEPGCTHEGSKEAMLRLLEAAKSADADVWKPQWVSNPDRMLARRNISPEHPKHEYYKRCYSWLSFPVEWHAEFSKLCHELGMQYAVTCFLPEDFEAVAKYADTLKIASFEAGDPDFVDAACDAAVHYGIYVVASTGMGADPWHGEDPWFFRLHCVSAYPSPIEQVNLGAMIGDCEGLSDHSRDIDMGMMAVCAGATIIETHYRLYDCDPDNPDYPVSFDPGELAMYIAKIRKAERALGDGVKKVQPSEEAMLAYRVHA